MTRRTSRKRSSRRLRPNKGFDTVYYWNGKWRAAAPLPPPLGRGETLGEMKAAVERMGYVAVLGSVARGAPKTPPWRLQQNSRRRSRGRTSRKRASSRLRRNSKVARATASERRQMTQVRKAAGRIRSMTAAGIRPSPADQALVKSVKTGKKGGHFVISKSGKKRYV